ncbi:tail fiber domain-containing protein [Ohtaekwangia kribbensis]|uniref:Tail fiber domain-containing protein n=1 Tax=Ohtaekwangia kribbensis TaxID=688913 RepID=A0ABW3K2E8_9BACT
MKKTLLIILLYIGVHFSTQAQSIGINSTGADPAASAMLDIASTNSGLLIPRVALTATNAATPVTSPATSLLVYNTATAGTAPNNVVPGYYFWNGSAWALLVASSTNGNVGIRNISPTQPLDVTGNVRFSGALMPNNSAGTTGYILQSNGANNAPTWVTPTSVAQTTSWLQNGNAVTSIQSIGTTSNFALPFITNNVERMRLTTAGNLGIGSSTFDGTNPEKLLVDAGTTTSYNLMTGRGSIDNYLQINVKNNSGGGSASSDIVATSNNGTESVNYIDMGINSGGYSNTSLPVLGGANTAYLYATGNDFVIGNGTATRPLRFFTGGFTAANERLRIDGSGRVGIGNTSPAEVLDVTGNVRFTGALSPAGSAGTSGQILQSNGTNTAPSWVAPSTVVGSSTWVLDGNNVAAARSFGTTSNFDLPFITNNTEKMRITATGNVGIGTSTPTDEKLLVEAGTTIQTAISAVGTLDDFLEINVQNFSNGALASSDVVATANNGTENSVYIDMGINSAGYNNGNSNILNGANLGYLYSNANDLKIGNGSPGRNLIFFTNPVGGILGTNTANGLERLRITSAGFVGIGTNNPTHLLHLGADDAVKPGGGSWASPSDRRLKKDITDFTDGMNVIAKIKPVSFRYNGIAGLPDDGKQYIGIIAQDMQKAAPYTIDTFTDSETKIDYLKYDPNAVTYILINAVKEQQATIEKLQKQLDEQNKRLAALESKIK